MLRAHWSSSARRTCRRTDDSASCHRPPKAGATALTGLPPPPTNSRVPLLPPRRKLQAEGKRLRRETQGSPPEDERRAPGRSWRRDPRWGRVQAGGGARCRPGRRTPGRRYVTGGDTTFPSPEAVPLPFSAKPAGDGASSGQRLLRCQQLCAAEPGRAAPPRAGGRPRSPPGCLRGGQLRQRC